MSQAREFWRKPGVNRTASAASIAAVIVIATAAASKRHHSSAPNVPPKDRLSGQISNASGSYAGHRGRVGIYVQHRGSDRVTITLRGRPCPSGGHCLKLDGVLVGTLTRLKTIPDAGTRYRLDASGRITPLGAVTASGEARGTGFIAHGRESLTIDLAGSSGTVGVSATSGTVPGFTSP
jgi:hypothetical protein